MKKKVSDKLIPILSLISGFLCLIATACYIALKENSTGEFIFFIYLSLLIILAVLSVLIYLKKNMLKNTDSRYDIVREDIEKKIIDLQNQLSKTDEQWRSSYHLLLASQSKSNNENSNDIQNLTFLKNFGFSDNDYVINNNLVFYLTSFSTEYDYTYKVCKEICKGMQLNLIRGDETFFTGEIFSQIVKNIVSASLIIANIDGKNPNVFYELGIAHTLGKNVIFISKRNTDLPFDIRQHRIVFYNDEIELKKILPEYIKKFRQNFSIPSHKKAPGRFLDNFMEKDNYYSFFYQYIQEYLKEKKYTEALMYCKEFLENNPTNTTILLTVGNIYSEMGADEVALEYYKKAIETSHKSMYAPPGADIV